LQASGALRRAVTDPARDHAAKSALVTDLFAKSLSKSTLDLLDQTVALRWSRTTDIVDAIEQLAVEAEATVELSAEEPAKAEEAPVEEAVAASAEAVVEKTEEPTQAQDAQEDQEAPVTAAANETEALVTEVIEATEATVDEVNESGRTVIAFPFASNS